MFTSEDCPVKIADISDWRPVSQIPSNGSTERDNDNSSGVYQIAHVSDIKEIGDTLVHQNIGYTGKGKNVYDRTYTVRQPKGSHGKYSRAQDALEELTSIELLDIISFARELAVSKNAVEFQNKLKSVI